MAAADGDTDLAAALARLHACAFTTPPPWSAAAFAALLGDPAVILQRRRDSFALWRLAGGEAELLTLAVAPPARRQGRASALLATGEAALRRAGAARIALEVGAGNAAARALYARAGYGLAGRRRGYYRAPDGTADDALILTKTLSPTP